ncbi:hypothetical protein C4D60_Mb01t27180 [Musa balbisiana]|uniref:Uncharacterized protein n=1 Tax=Musa balbisiana TaxID=52838 RepID=A0A4S8JR32_MUSBA|nr:hypothetical protein C4D60_Mb01t27180 [Musa balbisiana]
MFSHCLASPPSCSGVACRLPRNGTPLICSPFSAKLNTLFLICFRNNTRRNHISYNGSACMMRFLNAVYHGLLVGLVPNTQKNGRLLLGVGRSISSERQEDGDEDDRDINVNTVQTDIVLSKEVLTIQRSLLNQRWERRIEREGGRGKREMEQRGGQLREERRKGMGGKLLRVGGEDSSDDCCLLWTEEERGKREERRDMSAPNLEQSTEAGIVELVLLMRWRNP